MCGCASDDIGEVVIDSVEECEDAGGYVLVSVAGRIQCADREEEIGTIPQGIEASICCRLDESPHWATGPSDVSMPE